MMLQATTDTPLHLRAVSLLGMIVLLVIGWLLSTDRRAVPWRVLLWGIGLQFVFALLILRTGAGRAVFAGINRVVIALLGFTVEGASFLFGNLVWNNVPVGAGAAGSNEPVEATASMVAQTGRSSRSTCCRQSSSSRRSWRCSTTSA